MEKNIIELKFDEHELVGEIADRIIKYWEDSARKDFLKYSEMGNVLEKKIGAIVEESKDKIIERAAEIFSEKLKSDLTLRAILAALAEK